jgi:DNA-binding beta-propeller fold protein YncE
MIGNPRIPVRLKVRARASSAARATPSTTPSVGRLPPKTASSSSGRRLFWAFVFLAGAVAAAFAAREMAKDGAQQVPQAVPTEPQTQTGAWGIKGEFSDPEDVAVDGQGNVYVTDGASILKLSRDGELLSELRNGDFYELGAIAIDSLGNLYVADSSYRMFKLSSQGDLLAEFQIECSWVGCAGDIAIDGQGNIYYTDSPHILKMSPTGELLARWGDLDTFNYLEGIALDKADNVYVTENFWSHRITKLSPDGQILWRVGCEWNTGEPCPYDDLERIAVGASQNVYVVEFYSGRVVKLSGAGVTLGEWHMPDYAELEGLAVDNTGFIYVTDGSHGRVARIDLNASP